MNILILGSGGREHALAWKIAASPLVEQLYCAPGNAGIRREAQCMALDPSDHAAVIAQPVMFGTNRENLGCAQACRHGDG